MNKLGIVLKRSDYRENDALLKVLMEDNQIIDFIVKGVLKPNSKNNNSCEIGSISEFDYEVNDFKNLQILKKAKLQKYDFSKIRYNLLKQAILQVLLETTLILDEDELNFDLLKQAILTLVDIDDVHANNILLFYLVRIISKLGYQAEVDKCVKCGDQNHINYFSIDKGGFICRNCLLVNSDLNVEELKKIRLLFKAQDHNLDVILKQDLTNVETVIIDYFTHYCPYTIKSLRFWKQVSTLS